MFIIDFLCDYYMLFFLLHSILSAVFDLHVMFAIYLYEIMCFCRFYSEVLRMPEKQLSTLEELLVYNIVMLNRMCDPKDENLRKLVVVVIVEVIEYKFIFNIQSYGYFLSIFVVDYHLGVNLILKLWMAIVIGISMENGEFLVSNLSWICDVIGHQIAVFFASEHLL